MVGKIHFFEGAEKCLEMWFMSNDERPDNDLRLIPRFQWETLVKAVNAEIISEIRNEEIIAFLLSESSLIVSKNRVIIKTCGTTMCLEALVLMQKLAMKYCGMEIIEDLFYSRRNFLEPDDQLEMHTSFANEVKFLNKHVKDGAAYIMGKVDVDCWYLFTKVKNGSPTDKIDQTFEVLMSGLDLDCVKEFYQSENLLGSEATRRTGIDKIIPGSKIDSFQFEPCGYSANGLIDGYYWTMHVTPEPEFSYASFETNFPVESYEKILETIVNILNPSHLNVTAIATKSSVLDMPNLIEGFSIENYAQSDLQMTKFPSYMLHYSSYDVNSLPDLYS